MLSTDVVNPEPLAYDTLSLKEPREWLRERCRCMERQLRVKSIQEKAVFWAEVECCT